MSDLGSRLESHPWLMLRLFVGVTILGLPVRISRAFVDWFCGFRRECNFAIVWQRDLGYGVKLAEGAIRWYDDLDQASQALVYHAAQWRDSRALHSPDPSPTGEPKT